MSEIPEDAGPTLGEAYWRGYADKARSWSYPYSGLGEETRRAVEAGAAAAGAAAIARLDQPAGLAAATAALAAERERADAAEAALAEAREQVGHLSAALSGDSEGVRLWMLDCARLTAKHRDHAAEASVKLGRVREIAGNFLGQYGHSDIPMFRVGQDLANSVMRTLGAPPGTECGEPEPRLPPAELWEQSGGNRERYRDLLHRHGHVLAPGDDGYDPGAPQVPPCGWSPS